MKPDTIRALGWACPILCMLIAGYILFSQNSAFKTASANLDQATKDLEAEAQKKNTVDTQPPSRFYATKDDDPAEESNFLDYLRTAAGTFGVTIVSWSRTTSDMSKPAPGQDPKVASLLAGVKKVNSNLSLSGTYLGLREFIGELEASDRLYSLSAISWNRADPGGDLLTMTVSRYVATPKPPPGATPAH